MQSSCMHFICISGSRGGGCVRRPRGKRRAQSTCWRSAVVAGERVLQRLAARCSHGARADARQLAVGDHARRWACRPAGVSDVELVLFSGILDSPSACVRRAFVMPTTRTAQLARKNDGDGAMRDGRPARQRGVRPTSGCSSCDGGRRTSTRAVAVL